MSTKMYVQNTDDKYAALIREQCHSRDTENDHATADDILCQALVDLGATKIVDEFRQVKKWYATPC